MTTGISICGPEPLKLLLRLDAGHRVGLGHAVRSAALVERLGRPVELVVAGNGEALAQFFPQARLCPLGDDGDDLVRLVAAERPDAVLVDVPHLAEDAWRRLGTAGHPVIAVDDEGGAVVADLVINGTVLDSYHHYPTVATSARLLLGPDYTLLRPAFAVTPWRDPEAAAVTIVVGGGERARDWAFRLMEADHTGWGAITMVVGSAFPDRPVLAEACECQGITLRHGLDAAGLAQLLARAQVALITGGMVLYECMAVGTPAVVFPQVPNLPPEAEWFAAKGCIIDLGYEGGMDMNTVSARVGALLADRVAARRMAAKARACVDGHGLERAAAAINELLEEKTS